MWRYIEQWWDSCWWEKTKWTEMITNNNWLTFHEKVNEIKFTWHNNLDAFITPANFWTYLDICEENE